MKNNLLNILQKYLQIFPEEKVRQVDINKFLNNCEDTQITDWNNFNGHIVVGGFIYAKKEKKFLVLYHKDLKMYLYPGGHFDINDKNPLDAVKREILEETSLDKLKQIIIADDKLIPFDIDTHLIEYNERLDIPEHYHFEFRYLFTIDKIKDVKIDTEEISEYQWVDIKKLDYREISNKLENLLMGEK